jgi:GTP diphosphokinase / guanosine-3',5'-bis(diphosphate) 3'-diphosphatase
MRIKEICDAITSYHPSPDLSLIKRAYIYACYYHKSQKRLSGEPYIVHPLGVAKILTELRADDKTIAAGLLHDIAEDTPTTIEDIKKHFGNEVAFLIDGVTKISKFKINLNADERHIENLRKMFVFMAKDVRVVLIKLADRLDNMRSIEFLPEESRKRMADETLKIFAPIAHRLGLYNIKTELEDRAFEVLYPEAAEYIKKRLKKIREEGEKIIKETEKKVAEILEKEGIEGFKIESRIKGIYSIWDKTIRQGIDIENIYDIIGLRIIVKTIPDCYRVLGVLHSYFKPIPGKFKDYIAIPKPNGYKSLHTKVILPGGNKVEFQVRTYEMHKEAEEGISAHWAYKEKSPISQAGMKIFSWLRNILELSRENPEYEVEKIVEDIYPDEIYVFTPKGDVKVLPRGATVLDFAYSIHSELGATCVGAKVNGKLQPIDYTLKSGDVVEIITSKNQKPKRSWLNIVITQRAKSRIKQFINKEEKQVAKEIGEETLKKELRRLGISFYDIIKTGQLHKVINSLNIKDLDELFILLGSGKISVNYIIKNLKKFLNGQKLEKGEEKESISQQEEIKELRGSLKGIKTRFALCCTPVHGDDVVGYITRGYGIVIHRKDCEELSHLDKERLIKIPQDELPNDQYISRIRFFADSQEVISDVIAKIKKEGFEVKEFRAKGNDEKFEFEIRVKVKDKSDVEKIISELSSMKNIQNIGRAI